MSSDRRRTAARRAASAVAWACLAPAARADNAARSWVAPGSGNWSTAADWSPAGVPGNGDGIEIAAPATGARTVTYDYAGPAVTLSSLLLDGKSNGTFPPTLTETLAIPAGTLAVTNGQIGKGVAGTVAQSGGAVTFGPAGYTTGDVLNLGYSDGYGLGTYQLSGGSLTVNGQELVGEDSVGAFNQSGGTHAVTGNILVGNYTAPGSFTLTGGATQAPAVTVGYTDATVPDRYGTMTVAGTGRLTLTGTLTVKPSATAGPPNVLTLAGGGSITAAALSIPTPAQFNWTGGSLTLTGQTFAVGASGPVAGGLNLPSTLTLAAGQSLAVVTNPASTFLGSQTEVVGQTAAGTLVQSGGTNVTNRLTLGAAPTASGAYNLAGGSLTAGIYGEAVASAGPATFSQTGGTNTTYSLTVGGPTTAATGTYALGGGTLSPGAVTVAATGTFNQSAAGTLSVTAAFTNAGRTSLGGPQRWAAGATFNNTAGSATFSTDAAGTTPAAPTLAVVAHGGTIYLDATQHWANLSIGSAGTVSVAPSALLVTPTLTLAGSAGAWQGRLDLDGAADVPGGSLTVLSGQAAQGFDAGRWDGPGGIASAAAAADSRHLTVVGVIQNATSIGGSTPIYTAFDGQPVSATDVLARDTYYGDTNLDGVVNAADYTRIDAGYINHLTGWLNGDFNYDGVVDGSDYTLMDNAFNQQTGGFAAPALAVAPAPTAVPEPTAVAGLAALALACLRRRRP